MNYKHYFRINKDTIIIKVFSDAFVVPLKDDICFNDKAERHCNIDILTNNRKFKYKWDGTKKIERTLDEIEPLEEYKLEKINTVSEMSLKKRQALIPDYKLLNASVGVYEEITKLSLKNTIQEFREEFYRLKYEIEIADSKTKINNLILNANFPTELQ